MFSEDWWLQLAFHLGIGGDSFSGGWWVNTYEAGQLRYKCIAKLINIKLFAKIFKTNRLA